MKTPNCEVERNAPLSKFEKASAGILLLWLTLAIMFFCGALSGCRAFYENAGSRTVVGSVTAPVDISDSSDNLAAKLLYSMDGASVYTAKDSLVKIAYTNIYTNSYIGIVQTRGTQNLTVEIEPLAVEEPSTNTTSFAAGN